MNDRELDQLIARAARPLPPATADSSVLGRGRYELLEEIMTTPITIDLNAGDPGDPDDIGRSGDEVPGGPPPRRRFSTTQRLVAGLAVAAAFLAAVAIPTFVLRDGDDVTVKDPYTASARAAAAASPRILIDDPTWTIDDVYKISADESEISFVKGDAELQVNWRRAADYQTYYDDRLGVSAAQPIQVLGQDGALFTYSKDDYAVILPVEGKSFVELRGEGSDRAAFGVVVGKLKKVSVDEWLAAMPASVVKPGDEKAVADEMLADVPVPDGFDRSTLPSGEANDYYQYGANVIGKVTCVWLRDYAAARQAGDQAGMAEVDAALGGSRDWAVLKKMDVEGDYPEVIWEYANDVHSGAAVTGYQRALGCA